MIRTLMCRLPRTSGATGGIATAVPTYVREQSLRSAAWRAATTAVENPAHVPAAPMKREADFVHSGIPGGGPPV